MQFKFKEQQYQLDAVEAIASVFEGQPKLQQEYRRDQGREALDLDDTDSLGYSNAAIRLDDKALLTNLQKVQKNAGVRLTSGLPKSSNSLGRISLDIEMETGTGKTYVYTRTMYELHKRYGWSKFVIVVPSIAIREGVLKSLECTKEHFQVEYDVPLKAFVYSSKRLELIDDFSRSRDLQVMVINRDSFCQENNIIYKECDNFSSRRPCDVIRANSPILILDEPQKITGDENPKKPNSTFQKLLDRSRFNFLFSLYFSATHKTQHSLVYRLGAVEAYNQKLVKRILVKGFDWCGISGAMGYLYLSEVRVFPNRPPQAVVELDMQRHNAPKRERRVLKSGDNIYEISGQLEQYRDLVVSDIDGLTGTVRLSDGTILRQGQVIGDVDEEYRRRLQIRETIKSHLEREPELFKCGVKTLSLFFIDEVSMYRVYFDGGHKPGRYAEIFEQEYRALVDGYEGFVGYRQRARERGEEAYARYLETDASNLHNGYFSKDGNTGHWCNGEESTVKGDRKSSKTSEDKDEAKARTYDLILKDKERLLGFEEPTRFIFSHSALNEGWDNPNVFQICTLRENRSDSTKRQQVGRGMRLCVNQQGERLDREVLKSEVHKVNLLTVVANECYKDFVENLQKELREDLSLDIKFFVGKTIVSNTGHELVINRPLAKSLQNYLLDNGYIEKEHLTLTPAFKADKESGELQPLPPKLEPFRESVFELISTMPVPVTASTIYHDGRARKKLPLNHDNFDKKFRRLWELIRRKFSYTVKLNSKILINAAQQELNDNLSVTPPTYIVTQMLQNEEISVEDVQREQTIAKVSESRTEYDQHYVCDTRFDLVGEIAKGTQLTRRTVVAILQGLKEEKFRAFRCNPQEFINEVVNCINACKGAKNVVASIAYVPLNTQFADSIFEGDESVFDGGISLEERLTRDRAKGPLQKAVQMYVLTDSQVENHLVDALESSSNVEVYAKLPPGYTIPTPVCDYNPDWAVVITVNGAKKVYFVAESKGSTDSQQLRPAEQQKIDCAKALYGKLNELAQREQAEVKYDVVDSYESLWNKACEEI